MSSSASETRLALTALERVALEGLAAREREIARLREPVERDFLMLRVEIENRLELPPGALGTTHGINDQTWEVTEVPSPDGGANGGIVPSPPH